MIMEDLLLRVKRYAQRYGLWAAGDAIVVGVSGGPDSLCLLHVLNRLAAEEQLVLHVAHLNHGLRGDAADADAEMVATTAAAWGLPCASGRADVRAAAGQPSVSLEEAARRARYRFLGEVARSVGARTVATGHHAGDQAETVLMHFLRGSGLAGLRGMLPRTSLVYDRLPEEEATGDQETAFLEISANGLWLVRPLLDVSRSDIAAYCVAHDLQPRYDATNEDTAYHRNRLRHELLPLLAQYNPAIREVLGRTAATAAADYELLQVELASAWQRLGLPAPADEVRLDLAGWRRLPLSLQRATLREAIRRLQHSLRNVSWEHVERAVWLGREGGTGQEATLVSGLSLRIGYTALRVAATGSRWAEDVPQLAAAVSLDGCGDTAIGRGWRVSVRRLEPAALPADYATGADPWAAYLDAGVVGKSLLLRPHAPGERFQPQGMGGHSIRIGDFMTNVKLPADLRSAWPLLAGNGGVAWLCGLRLDQRAVVRPATTEVLEVRFLREQKDWR